MSRRAPRVGDMVHIEHRVRAYGPRNAHVVHYYGWVKVVQHAVAGLAYDALTLQRYAESLTVEILPSMEVTVLEPSPFTVECRGHTATGYLTERADGRWEVAAYMGPTNVSLGTRIFDALADEAPVMTARREVAYLLSDALDNLPSEEATQ